MWACFKVEKIVSYDQNITVPCIAFITIPNYFLHIFISLFSKMFHNVTKHKAKNTRWYLSKGPRFTLLIKYSHCTMHRFLQGHVKFRRHYDLLYRLPLNRPPFNRISALTGRNLFE